MKEKTTKAKSSRLTMPLEARMIMTASELSWRKVRKPAFLRGGLPELVSFLLGTVV